MSVTGLVEDVLDSGNFFTGRITNPITRCGMSAARGTEEIGNMKCSECGSGMIGPMDWTWSKEVYGCPRCKNMWWPE